MGIIYVDSSWRCLPKIIKLGFLQSHKQRCALLSGHVHSDPVGPCLKNVGAPHTFNFLFADRRSSNVRSKTFRGAPYLAENSEHAWIGLWLVCTVQTVPRVRKKDIAEGRKSVRPDAAAAQAPSRPSDVATVPSPTSTTYDSATVHALRTDRRQTNDISYPKLDLTVGPMRGNKIM